MLPIASSYHSASSLPRFSVSFLVQNRDKALYKKNYYYYHLDFLSRKVFFSFFLLLLVKKVKNYWAAQDGSFSVPKRVHHTWPTGASSREEKLHFPSGGLQKGIFSLPKWQVFHQNKPAIDPYSLEIYYLSHHLFCWLK